MKAGSVDDHNVVPSSPTATPSKDLMKERRKSMVDRVSNIENETNSPLQNASLRKEVTNSPKGIEKEKFDLLYYFFCYSETFL